MLHELLLLNVLVCLDLPLHETRLAIRMLQVLFSSHTISDQVWVNVGLDAAFLCFDPLLQYLLIHQRFLSVMLVGRLC